MTTYEAGLGMLMFNEMLEQPKVLANAILRWDAEITDICAVLPKKIQGVVFVARGSSDNAATIGRYAVEAFAGIPARVVWSRRERRRGVWYCLPT